MSMRNGFGFTARLFFLLCLYAPPAAFAQTGQPIEVVAPGLNSQDPTSAAISADGRFLVTSTEDAVIKLWDVRSGRLIRNVARIDEERKSWSALAVSSDGRRTLGTISGDFKLWDSVSGKELLSVDDTFFRNSQAVLMTGDGRWVAAIVADTKLKLFDGDNGREVADLAGHTGNIAVIALSPDGKMLASTGDDKTIRLWETASGRLLQVLNLQAAASALSFSKDGSKVLANTADGLELWDAAIGGPVWRHASADQESSHLSADGASVIVLKKAGNETEIWDVGTQTRVTSFARPDNASVLAFPDAGKVLLSFTPEDGDWTIRTILTVDPQNKRPDDVTLGNGDLQLSDGRFALNNSDDGLLVYDLGAGRQMAKLEVSTNSDLAVLSASAMRVAIASPDEVLIANAENGQMIAHCPTSTAIAAMAFSGDEQRIAYSGDDGLLALCDIATATIVKSFGADEMNFSAVAISPDGKQILAGDRDGKVRLWDVVSGNLIRAFTDATSSITQVAFSPDGKTLMAGTDNNRVLIWSIGTAKSKRTLRMMIGPVRAMSVASDGKRMAAGPYGELMAKQWDIGSGHELVRLKSDYAGRFTAVDALAYSHAMAVMAATSNNHVVTWAVDSGRKLLDFSPRDHNIVSLAFSRDDKRLVSVDKAGIVKHWDRATGALMLTVVPSDKNWISVTPEGFFDASPAGVGLLSVVKGVQVAPVTAIHDQLQRADLVREKIAGDPKGLVKDAALRLDLAKAFAPEP